MIWIIPTLFAALFDLAFLVLAFSTSGIPACQFFLYLMQLPTDSDIF
jgi:hypothetical protein